MSTYRFADFELDPSRFELRRNGYALKLERIPMELLILLVEKDGNVATRQEIVDRLWGKDVFVDTEHGINTAIRKVRQTLRDDPEKPRFVQTVTGKGYRFVATTNGSEAGTPEAPRSMAGESPQPPPSESAMWGQPPRLSGGPEVSGRSAVLESAPTPERRFSRFAIAAIALVVLLAAALVLNIGGVRTRLFPTRAAQIHSIAVLPLANLSGDASQDYFADGMTDELITALAKNHNLSVVSRTSVMQYKGAQRPVKDIARELNVDGILEGSIVRTPTNVHMTVQLIYAPTDSHVWAESYDRALNQAYALPEELSLTIAKEVKVATSHAPAPRYISPEAHDAYLHGRYFWFATLDPKLTLPYFEKAIQLQPDYAAAWSGLADSYALEAMIDKPASEVSGKAHDAALKGLELDPSLAEAHNSMSAWYLFFAWDPVKAEAESRRALELDPNFAEGHHLLSYVLEVLQRTTEAEAEAKRCAELDPYIHPWELGAFYIATRQYDAAIKELKMQEAAHPDDSIMAMSLGKAYWLKGMYKESQEQTERGFDLQHDPASKAAMHKAWLAGGETAVELWGKKNIENAYRKNYFETQSVAMVVAFSGDNDATMKYLEISYRNHDPDLIFIQNEPAYDFLHSDPRYQALVKKMGLPPAR